MHKSLANRAMEREKPRAIRLVATIRVQEGAARLTIIAEMQTPAEPRHPSVPNFIVIPDDRPRKIDSNRCRPNGFSTGRQPTQKYQQRARPGRGSLGRRCLALYVAAA